MGRYAEIIFVDEDDRNARDPGPTADPVAGPGAASRDPAVVIRHSGSTGVIAPACRGGSESQPVETD